MIEDHGGRRRRLRAARWSSTPRAPLTVDALIAALQPERTAKRLVELFARRVELATSDEGDLRYALNVRAAECYEKQLGDRREAIHALNAALDARPGDAAVLSALERLYRAEELWDELLGNLQLQAGAAETKEARVKLRTAIGDLHAQQAGEPERRARAVPPGARTTTLANDHAIAAVRAIGEGREELRLDAADILEPVLRAGEPARGALAILELRLKAQTDARRSRQDPARHRLHRGRGPRPPRRGRGGAAPRPRGHARRRLAPRRHREAGRSRSDGWGRYADALAARAGATFDAVVAKDLFVRLGRIAEEKLKDDRRAVDAYAKAVEHAGDTPELLAALDRLHGRLGDQKALADVLERRVPLADSDKDRADLLHRLAVIQNRVVRRQGPGPLHAAAGAREGARPRRGPEGARGAHRHARALRGGGRGARGRLQGARRSRRAGAPLREAHQVRGDPGRARAPAPRSRPRARGALEGPEGGAGRARGGLRRRPHRRRRARRDRAPRPDHRTGGRARAVALDAAIRTADLPQETARDLWMRIAGWRKDKMGDPGGAELALRRGAQARPAERLHPPRDRGPPAHRPAASGSWWRRCAGSRRSTGSRARRPICAARPRRLAESVLKDDALVEAILREMIAADESDVWALGELTVVREKAGDHKEVFDLLVRQAELVADGAAIREKRHAAAAVAREKLGDDAKAIDLYGQIFEDEPSDAKAVGRAARALRQGRQAQGAARAALAAHRPRRDAGGAAPRSGWRARPSASTSSTR